MSHADLSRLRYSIRTEFHDIKDNVMNMQNALLDMKRAEEQMRKAKKEGVRTKDFMKTHTRTQKIMVPAPDGRHSTICGNCTHVCHLCCGLDELSGKGNVGIRRCSSHGGTDNCRVCPGQCSYQHHYHAKKIVQEKSVSFEEVCEDMKRTHLQAAADTNLANQNISSSADMQRLVDTAIDRCIGKLEAYCTQIKQICPGFNMVAEVEVLHAQLVAEKRSIVDMDAMARHGKIITAVAKIMNTYSTKR